MAFFLMVSCQLSSSHNSKPASGEWQPTLLISNLQGNACQFPLSPVSHNSARCYSLVISLPNQVDFQFALATTTDIIFFSPVNLRSMLFYAVPDS